MVHFPLKLGKLGFQNWIQYPKMATSPLSSQPQTVPRTLTQHVVGLLRDSILQGKLQGGQVLRQEDLATQLKVSRIPVREALRQLDAEGFVTLNPHHGAVVVSLSAEEVQEIYDIRVALETQALRLALPKFAADTLQQANAILDSIDQEVDVARWGELNWQFHEVLYRPALRPRLLAIIKSLHDNVGRYLRLYVALDAHTSTSQQHHRALLVACKKGDIDLAVQILETHLQVASRSLRDRLRPPTNLI